MAWTKKILRVNLSEGTVKSEPLNMEWAQAYLGQRGLATPLHGRGGQTPTSMRLAPTTS